MKQGISFKIEKGKVCIYLTIFSNTILVSKLTDE